MKDLNRKIIIEGYQLLREQKEYTQVTVINKLTTLGVLVSTATFSRLIKNERGGETKLAAVAEAIQVIIYKELGLAFDKRFLDKRTVDWQEEIIPESKNTLNTPDGFRFHYEGRLEVEEKVAFFSTATKEMVEFGVTLNTFSSYFHSRKNKTFKQPILDLLEQGVTLKCYLLNPKCREAYLYFNDRKTILPAEKGQEKITASIERLQAFQKELAAYKFKGKMELYTYKHVPNNYFLAIDGRGISGKMMVSHYLYGERRASCPVFEFTKKDNRELFMLYRNSLNNLMKDAVKLG